MIYLPEISFKKLKSIIYKIATIAEKNTLMLFRFKYGVIISFITPLISILIPILVFGKIFEFTSDFGPWTTENYIVFIIFPKSKKILLFSLSKPKSFLTLFNTIQKNSLWD